MDSISVKSCTNPDCPCDNPQPLTAFYRRKSGRVESRCALCCRNARKVWGKENPEKVQVLKKRSYEQQDKQVRNARERARYATNPRQREYLDAYRAANLEKVRSWARAYNHRNAHIVSTKRRLWRQRNPHMAKAEAGRRRKRYLGAAGSYTGADVIAKYEVQGGLCYYCEAELNGTGYELDHKIPLAKGGSNWPANLCCACPPCNHRKSAKSFWKFLESLNQP